MFKWGNGTNFIGNAFWGSAVSVDGKFAANKDDADNQPRLDKNINVYFEKACELRFVPRAALTNSELSSLDAIKASPIGTIVKCDNFVFGASGAGIRNNWTKAHWWSC